MNVSLNWLATHVDLADLAPESLEALLTFAGVEVEKVTIQGVPSDQIVVAQIQEATPHPDADKLKVTQVDAGEGSLRQIVCGAKNYQVGDKVPCCLPGTDLGGFVIRETKMRGVESRGMLAAASEIGLTDVEDGLLILPPDAPIGTPVRQLFEADRIIEVEVTPNRPDLLSHYGMARELAALLERPLKPLPSAPRPPARAAGIRVEAADACPYYTAIRLTGVTVRDSPAWLQKRLEAIGLRPINNLVDITNFVLHELGQPLHVFDAAQIHGQLVVRDARPGEVFQALDEADYPLEPGDCVISDESGAALALAGIMGGRQSGVTPATTEIVLEAAYFTPAGIRRTARRTGLMSDSSYRFERGVDPCGVDPAAARAVELIVELAGGEVDAVTLTAGSAPDPTAVVQLDLEQLDQLTGHSIPHARASEILHRLGLEAQADGAWQVPSFRADLRRHIDLVEEIVRVHGLDAIPSRGLGRFVPIQAADHAYDVDMRLRQKLAGLGFHECQTIKLISDAQLADALPIKPLRDGDTIRVSRPLSHDHTLLRPSLAPGLIASAARNLRQQATHLRLFEMGRFFRHAGGGKATDLEAEALAILLSGPVRPGGWDVAPTAADLHDLLGVVQALLPRAQVRLAPRERDGWALGADVLAGGQHLGSFGMLTPARQRELDAVHPLFVVELDLAKLRSLATADHPLADLPQFPGSTRDATFEAELDLPNAEVEKALSKLREPLLIEVTCVDRFVDPTGQKLAAERKALTYRFHYRSPEKTLKTQEVDQAHQQVLALLLKQLPITQR